MRTCAGMQGLRWPSPGIPSPLRAPTPASSCGAKSRAPACSCRKRIGRVLNRPSPPMSGTTTWTRRSTFLGVRALPSRRRWRASLPHWKVSCDGGGTRPPKSCKRMKRRSRGCSMSLQLRTPVPYTRPYFTRASAHAFCAIRGARSMAAEARWWTMECPTWPFSRR